MGGESVTVRGVKYEIREGWVNGRVLREFGNRKCTVIWLYGNGRQVAVCTCKDLSWHCWELPTSHGYKAVTPKTYSW